MEARFRIRTREGQELEPRTLEIFSEMVRSGVIRPEDLVFDALTLEWVPAGAHPMVRLFRDPLTSDPGGGRRAGGPGGGSGADPLSFALTEPTTPSPEEETAAFIRKMEEERRSDPQRAPLALQLPLDAGIVGARVAPPRSRPPDPEAPPAILVRAPERRARRRRDPWWGILGVTVVATGFAALVLVRDAGPAAEVPAATMSRAERPLGVGVRGEESEVRLAARSAFLDRVSALRAEAAAAEVPAVWLEGRYLAEAAAHPEVRRYWERALGFVDELRRREDALYREAWLDAADGLGLDGPVRSLRLAAALEDFAAGASAREGHYGRVRELAAAALALHDVLVELGDRVVYQPQRGPGVSADPVLEAAGADPAAQALLEVALDRVLTALRGPDGASLRERDRLAAWMVDVP